MSEEIDKKGLTEVKALTDRVSSRWKVGMLDILRERNPELLASMTSLENQIDSLLLLPIKPKETQKKWKETLDEYERACNRAIAYAERHIASAAQI